MSDESNGLDDILKNVEETDNAKEETKDVNPDILLSTFLTAVQGITVIISEHTGLKSVALTDSDIKVLNEALKPFVDYIASFVKLIVFLPLIMFLIGYTMRIVSEMKEKKKYKSIDNAHVEVKREVYTPFTIPVNTT